MFYHPRIYFTREIYFPVQGKVLYRPQGILFIIRGVAEYNKKDPERPILHFSLHRKVNFECIVNSRVVKIFTQFENPLYKCTDLSLYGSWNIIYDTVCTKNAKCSAKGRFLVKK